MSFSAGSGWKRWWSSKSSAACRCLDYLCDGWLASSDAHDRRVCAYPRIDPLDQTALTYMDSGEVIPCDLVVLKDAEGNVITVT